MSDMNDLANKYRPNKLEDYMGGVIREKMLNLLKDESTYPQITLLHGHRGCGKTTMAYLLAKEIMCTEKVNGRACGKCIMCKEIEEKLIHGTSDVVDVFGVMELNASLDNGKGTAEKIIDDVKQPPVYPAKYKVYILDEAHMLSHGAQNAFLKPLEQPPKYCIFIICTTEKEKLLPTLLDRCREKIPVKSASPDELLERLLYVCEKEGIKTSKQALMMIINDCKKNPRNCLTTLGSIASSNGMVCTVNEIMKEKVHDADELYMEYYRQANMSLEGILRIIDKIEEKGIEYNEFIGGLAEFTLNCIQIKYGIGIDKFTEEYVKVVKEFFKHYNTEELDLLLQIMEYASKSISGINANGKLVLSTTALRIGKIKFLAKGLQGEKKEALKETAKGNKLSADMLKEERENTGNNVEDIVLDSADMQSVFGKQLAEVSQNIELGDIIEEDDSDGDEDGTGTNDEDFIKEFEDFMNG